MAPDLNSVPPSPRNPAVTAPSVQQTQPSASHPSSRRASQISPMSPPPLPLATPGGTIPTPANLAGHHSYPFPPLSPVATSGSVSSVDGMAVPTRHPRPLTAAELHLEVEQEQEAIVNRLTRELSALRAHSASVASNTSVSSNSTSASAPLFLSDSIDPTMAHTGALIGPSHPTLRRQRRSSSSVSASRAPHPHSASVTNSSVSSTTLPGGAHRAPAPEGGRYEEVVRYRSELDEAKRENEMLRKRVRELEAQVRRGRSQGAERPVDGVSRDASVSASERAA